MVRIYGNADRGGIGGVGVEVPIDPPAVSAQVAAARLALQVRRQEAAEDAAAAARPKRRSRTAPTVSAEGFTVASMSPVPARVVSAPATPPPPPAAPAVVDAIEDLVPAGPVPCEAPDCRSLVSAEFVAKTGQRIHPPCRTRLQAAASSTSRRAGELAATGGRSS
jgi:hypothetical protein